MRYSTQFGNTAPRGSERRVVIDYTSRSVKWRLFTLVAALMLVLIAAEQARKPENWKWFFALEGRNAEQRIDNRLAVQRDTESNETIVIEESSASAGAEPAGEPKQGASAGDETRDGPAQAWLAGLTHAFHQLSSEERTLLFRLLESAQDHRLWPADERAPAEQLVAALERHWNEHQAEAFQAASLLTGREQAEAIDTLRQVNTRFAQDVQAPLLDVAAGKVVLPAQEASLQNLLADVMRLSLHRVQDDRPFLRPDEKQIWLHLFWKLRRTPEKELAAASMGNIPYAQLYRQPEVYRGQVVTVRGTARWAYRVRASDNHLGIDEYFVFWIQPADSVDTPLVIYALDLPRGFHNLRDRDREGGLTRLHDEVAFDGYFFKRGGYAGKGGTYNAPLVLAKVARWQPDWLALKDESLSAAALAQIVVASLAVAALLVGGAYWAAFRRTRRREAPAREVAVALHELKAADVAPSVEESLRRLEREAFHGGADQK
jgi:hypothetical protein